MNLSKSEYIGGKFIEDRISRGKAIRLKCLDCCGGSSNEVKLCTAVNCPLHPFRFGTDPYRVKTELSPEQREQRLKSLALARSKQTNSQEKNGKPRFGGLGYPWSASPEIKP